MSTTANVPPSARARIAVVRAIGGAAREVEDVLALYLDDELPDVREAAALAIAARGPARLGPRLLAQIGREPEPSVRSALYMALAEQVGFNVRAATDLACAESNVATRLAGFAALAAEAARHPAAAAIFDYEVVPELATRVLGEDDRKNALAAVSILAFAMTIASRRTLRTVARRIEGDVGAAARAALAPRNKRPGAPFHAH